MHNRFLIVFLFVALCVSGGRGALVAGLLVPLLLVMLALVFCCCCCGGGPADRKERSTSNLNESVPTQTNTLFPDSPISLWLFRVNVADGVTSSSRMKHHVYNVLANVSSAVPCMSVWSSGLPRVTGETPSYSFMSCHIPSWNFITSYEWFTDTALELWIT